MKVYVLAPEGGLFGTVWAYGEPREPVILGDPPKCPVCGNPVGLHPWLPPHKLSLSAGDSQRWGDFLWAGSNLFISARAKHLYDERAFKGFSMVWPEAEVARAGYRKSSSVDTRSPSYHGVSIDWDGASLNERASGIVVKYPEQVTCPYCRTGGVLLKRSGIVLNSESWKGADIFRARGAGEILVTERFKQIVDLYQLSNVRLLPAERYAYEHPGRRYVRDE